MNQDKLKKFIIMSLLIVETVFIILSIKSFSNKTIDEVKNNNIVDKKIFSMYVENDNGKYSEYISSNMFPEGYQINLTKSSCVDTKGNEIDGILSGSKNNVTVTSNKTTYCYIYFDIDRPATEELLATVSKDQLWDSTLEDDGYRYVGTNPDNYICFGTTDQEECKKDTDKYMYRIIGIFEDSEGNQHLKLIKKEALNQKYAWHSAPYADTNWEDSDLYKGINGSYFATNSDYSYMQDSAWNNLITEWNYTATNTLTKESSGLDYSNITTEKMYLHELNRSTKTSSIGEWKTVNAKIGLMYASDYQLSLGINSLNYTLNDNSTLKTGWLQLSNSDNNPPSLYEYTITRYGMDDYNNMYGAFYIYKLGGVGLNYTHGVDSLRPVFYLESNTKLDKGKGTIEDPYTIEISQNLREYCEEYNNINECIKKEENNIEEVSDLWNSTLEEDGIRYVGTNPNNYVCFGTTNTSECTKDTDKYMYRIIGIFEDGEGKQHLKLIKKEALNQKYAWHSDKTIDTDWEESDLYKGINDSYFATNEDYSYMQDSAWNNLVATWKYISTNTKTYENSGPNYYYQVIKITYLHEMNRSGKTNCYYNASQIADCSIGEWKEVNSKIGLMYVSDYQLSLGNVALDYTNSNSTHYASMKTGWMNISNNDMGTPSSWEWTSTRLGFNDTGCYRSWDVDTDGTVDGSYVNNNGASVRPVFYLIENIKITSGKGSITEPFIIS